MTNGFWKKYNPSRFHRKENKRIEMELHQKINRLIWKRMEQHSEKTPEEKSRQEELFRVIEKIINTPIQNNTNEQGTSEDTTDEKEDYSEETTSKDSNDSMDVPVINFKKYMGATGVRYIQMGQASHVQENKEWNL